MTKTATKGGGKSSSAAKKPTQKTTSKRSNMGVYTSLTSHSNKKIVRSNKRTKTSTKKQDPRANLRPLPKEPIPRFFAHFRWERIKNFWFSKRGIRHWLELFAACCLIGVIALGGLFVYYKNQIKDIQLSNLQINDTVNTYLDRNGEVLWEDKGDSNYRLVVEEDEFSTYIRQATVAIEDRNFYSHGGVDFVALIRATISTLTGQGVQGGSTLTQQLIKQVYFSDEAASENRGGLSRKIRELILSIELEKMYSKEQILTMYLNESPYGGRRNGVESAARTYFGKSAKDLNLAESALLAAIPNNPAVLNPYNEYGHELLIERQHKVLNDMVSMGYITQEEATEAKEVAILDQIQPEGGQYANIQAPHFVIEVKKYLEEKYGIATMRAGGYTITTTLDLSAQRIAEDAVNAGSELRYLNNSDNIAFTSVDVETSQVIAMVGSIDWNTPIYGEVNAATASLEPGSTIKPLLDYAALFSLTGDAVYGPGTILKDENIDSYYCAGYQGTCSLRNASGQFYGDVTIRQSLGNSFNIGAVKALAIVGIDKGLETLHALGDLSYCADNANAGLSMAIGSGCGVRMDEHANAYASLARGGVYKELSYVLEVKDNSGRVLEAWTDPAGTRAIDEQVAYELSSILSDSSARTITFGASGASFGFVVPGVWTATKTGTTTTTNSSVTKDSWMASYSPAVSAVAWNGNHDGSGLSSVTNNIVRRVINDYMERVHKEVYANNGKWTSGDTIAQPSGIQTLTVNGKTDIWPSWYNSRNSGITTEEVEFNSVTKVRAAECTPSSVREKIEVQSYTDPITKTVIRTVPDGYDYDTVDSCAATNPTVQTQIVTTPGVGGASPIRQLQVTFTQGTYSLKTYELSIDGTVVQQGNITSEILASGISYRLNGSETRASITVTDESGRTGTAMRSLD